MPTIGIVDKDVWRNGKSETILLLVVDVVVICTVIIRSLAVHAIVMFGSGTKGFQMETSPRHALRVVIMRNIVKCVSLVASLGGAFTSNICTTS